MNLWTNFVVGLLYRRLSVYCEENNLGLVLPPGTRYRCFWDDDQRVRQPSLSFIRTERLWLASMNQEREVDLIPDLAVEFVFGREEAREVVDKVGEWESAGVRLIWVVDRWRPEDEISGEDVLPGFWCRVGELVPTAGARVPGLLVR